MTPGSLIVLVSIALATGDIHRCEVAEGVRYQDRPCEGDGGAVLHADPDQAEIDAGQVRRWLDDLNAGSRPRGTGTARNGPPPSRRIFADEPAVELPPRPESARLQSSCSVQFYGCTNGDAGHTDACVAEMKVCSHDRRLGCCHGAFIERYRRLRAAGANRQTAIRVSLLGSKAEAQGLRQPP